MVRPKSYTLKCLNMEDKKNLICSFAFTESEIIEASKKQTDGMSQLSWVLDELSNISSYTLVKIRSLKLALCYLCFRVSEDIVRCPLELA